MLIQIKETIINLNEVSFIIILPVARAWALAITFSGGYSTTVIFNKKEEALEVLNKIVPLQNTIIS